VFSLFLFCATGKGLLLEEYRRSGVGVDLSG
jgi:hypothetical protein